MRRISEIIILALILFISCQKEIRFNEASSSHAPEKGEQEFKEAYTEFKKLLEEYNKAEEERREAILKKGEQGIIPTQEDVELIKLSTARKTLLDFYVKRFMSECVNEEHRLASFKSESERKLYVLRFLHHYYEYTCLSCIYKDILYEIERVRSLLISETEYNDELILIHAKIYSLLHGEYNKFYPDDARETSIEELLKMISISFGRVSVSFREEYKDAELVPPCQKCKVQ